MKEKLPHSQAALILGISSIITACCCYGVVGIILGVIGIMQANKAVALHNQDPDLYTGINNANTGKTTSIIGIILGVITVIVYLYILNSGQYEILMEQYQEMLESQTE